MSEPMEYKTYLLNCILTFLSYIFVYLFLVAYTFLFM